MKRSDPVPRAPSRLERRAFIAMISGSLLAAPLVAGAQPAGKVYRIGFLRAGQPPETYLEDFQQGLRERSTARMWSSNSEPPTAASISFRGLPKSWCA